jgi:PAS domain S-box-containing protein
MQDSGTPLLHTADGLWAVDPDRRIVLWNQAAEELLGYSAEEAIGQFCYQLLAGRDPRGRPFCQHNCLIMGEVLQDELVGGLDLQIRHRDGRRIWIAASILVMPMRAQDDAPLTVHLFRQVAEGLAWAPPLRIHLLGAVTVQRADGSLVGGPLWRRAKTRALLAFLALRRGQPVHRTVLLEALWPHLEYDAALRNLNVTVHHLRHSLEPALAHGSESRYIQYDQDCYQLAGGEGHWLDVHAFKRVIGQARRERDAAQAIQRYRDALALYRGEFLADLAPDILDCWMERERLNELRLLAMEELAALYASRQQEAEATELLLKVLSSDACRETAVQALMRLALERGDRPAALTHYRQLEAALGRELEIRPGSATRALFDRACA